MSIRVREDQPSPGKPIRCLLEETAELSRMGASLMLDLNNVASSQNESANDLSAPFRPFLVSWYQEILRVAGLGMTAASLHFEYGNPEKKSLGQIKGEIAEAIRAFFAGTTFSITQLSGWTLDWRTRPKDGTDESGTGEPDLYAVVRVIIGLSWKA